MSNSIRIGGILKVLNILVLAAFLFITGNAMAQSPDSFMVTTDTAPPGGTATVSIFLLNTQFPVGGFSMRFILTDSTSATFESVQRGDDFADFEYFHSFMTDGTCRIVGVANVPGGGNPAPLEIGLHELAIVNIAVDENADWGIIDSVLFENDDIPPAGDNSISDSTGYILESPSLGNGWILIDVFQNSDEPEAQIPSSMGLAQNYPNPFNAETRISFETRAYSRNVSIEIYDLVGRLVQSYGWDGLEAGTHSVIWDGSDKSGRVVASGIYFYRLDIDSRSVATRRMTLLK